MKRSIILMILLIALSPVYGQNLLKKAKEKANAGSKILRDIKGNDAKKDKETSDNQEEYSDDTMTNSRSGRPSNSKGKKLTPSSVNVNQEISIAEASLKSKDYGKTRNSIQQAILGIEVAMAYKILESLPNDVSGLKAEKETDHVAASGSGYSGLTVSREYYEPQTDSEEYSDYDEENAQRYLKYTLVNSSLFTAGITSYIANPTYSSDQEGDRKIVEYKGIRSVLEFSDYEGYTLSVPVGDNTLVQFNCVNFDDEAEVLKAANTFDMEKVKQYLGE